jgi:hypothetical protein
VSANGPPPIPACKLWEKTSANGRRYLVGRLGGLRVLVFENRDYQAEGDATHVLLVGQAPDYPQQHRQATAAPDIQPPAQPRAPRQPARQRRPQPAHADDTAFHDDEPLP